MSEMIVRTARVFPLIAVATAVMSIPVVSAMPAAAQVKTASAVTTGASVTTAAVMTTKRVLVQPLKVNSTIDREAPGLGGVMAEMLTTALLSRGVRIVERQQLGALEAEKNLGSGVLDTNSAQKTGKIKGASVAVIGTISEFGVRDVKNGAMGILGGVFGGGVKRSELRIKIDAHLVDIATGDIMPGSQVVQEGKQVDTSWFAGAGTLFRGIPLGAIAGGSSNEWLESKAGKAARKIVEQIADQIALKIPKTAAGAEEEETREVEAVGFADFSDADRFVQSLKQVPGVSNVEANDFEDGVQKMTVTASMKILKSLPTLLQSDAHIKPFGFKVSGINKARIQLKKTK
jgi:curli biogenesis system outer membrane secretion channel CsgG